VSERNATVAVIGAGDYIADIESAGGRIVARSLDARKEAEIVAFIADADRHAPLEVCIFNIGANVNFPLLETTERVTGATASLRGSAGYAAFASAKFALRAVAQSAARELGPRNIHVAHLIIDAGVDTAFVRERVRTGGEDALTSIDDEIYFGKDRLRDVEEAILAARTRG